MQATSFYNMTVCLMCFLMVLRVMVEWCLTLMQRRLCCRYDSAGRVNGFACGWNVVMLLIFESGSVPIIRAQGNLRVALATTHLPLQQVSAAITDELLAKVIRILDHDLRTRFGLPAPRILVCGLNPHAGESGHLGREEIDVIAPTLERLRQEGLTLIGPAPADTAFTPHMLKQADAVLAMFHDQGLPVIKYAGFGDAVNITLGLPLVRTSVDHGTALTLAGTGQADASSLVAAIEMAQRMTHASTSQTIRPALPA